MKGRLEKEVRVEVTDEVDERKGREVNSGDDRDGEA